MPNCTGLAVPVDDPAAREVVRRKLDLHAVARQDADVVLAHLSRDVAEDAMAVVEVDPEHHVRQRLDDRAVELDRVFLGVAGASELFGSLYLLLLEPRLTRAGPLGARAGTAAGTAAAAACATGTRGRSSA